MVLLCPEKEVDESCYHESGKAEGIHEHNTFTGQVKEVHGHDLFFCVYKDWSIHSTFTNMVKQIGKFSEKGQDDNIILIAILENLIHEFLEWHDPEWRAFMIETQLSCNILADPYTGVLLYVIVHR